MLATGDAAQCHINEIEEAIQFCLLLVLSIVWRLVAMICAVLT